MSNKIYCGSCGADNPESFKFCGKCGSPLIIETQIPEEETTNNMAKPIVHQEPTKRPTPKKTIFQALKLIQACALVLLALLIVISSLLPIVKMEHEISVIDFNNLEHSVGNIENVKYFVNSLMSQDIDEIKDSSLYLKNQEIEDRLYDIDEDEYDSMTQQEKRLVISYIENLLLMSLRAAETKPLFFVLLSIVVGVAFLMIGIFLLVFSIKHLLAIILQKEENTKAPLPLLCAILPLDIIFYFFTKMNTRVLWGGGYSVLSLKMTTSHILMIVFLCVLLLSYAIPNFIRTRKSIALWISRIAVFAFSVTILCSLFLPIFNASVTARFNGDDKDRTVTLPMYSDYYFFIRSTDDAAEKEVAATNTEEYKELIENTLWNYRYSKRSEVLKGERYYTTYSLAKLSLAKSNVAFLNLTYAYVLVFCLSCFVAILVQKATLGLLSPKKYSIVGFNSGALAVSIILFALSIAIMFISNYGMPKSFSMNLGASYIVIMVFAILNYIAQAIESFAKKKPVDEPENKETPIAVTE